MILQSQEPFLILSFGSDHGTSTSADPKRVFIMGLSKHMVHMSKAIKKDTGRIFFDIF